MTTTLLDELNRHAEALTQADWSHIQKLVNRLQRAAQGSEAGNLAFRAELVAQLLAGMLTDVAARSKRPDDLDDVLLLTDGLLTFLMVRVRAIIAGAPH